MNWFDNNGAAYARFRPGYPPELAGVLAGLAPTTQLAVDVGCGTGQLTEQLAPLFDAVIGVDPSVDQLASAGQRITADRPTGANPRVHVRYSQARAENLPVANASTALITAAQAAHWFDLAGFYDEVRRIAEPRAVLALISYGVLTLDEAVEFRFRQFYYQEIGSHWPAQRKLVDEGYRTLPFPFDEIDMEPLMITRSLTLAEFLGYISTWSAVRAAQDADRADVLAVFGHDLAELWGDPELARRVVWPVSMRVGRV